jgi:hypothetical protein
MYNAHPAHLFPVIFTIEEFPLLAALKNLLLLRTDFLADLRVHLLFFFEQAYQDVHYILANGGAVLDELNVLPGDEDVSNDVGQANGLFPA